MRRKFQFEQISLDAIPALKLLSIVIKPAASAPPRTIIKANGRSLRASSKRVAAKAVESGNLVRRF